MPTSSSKRTKAANSGSATPRLKIRSVSRPPSVTKRPPDSCGSSMATEPSHRSGPLAPVAHQRSLRTGIRTRIPTVTAVVLDSSRTAAKIPAACRLVGPPVRNHLTVAALWAWTADRDQLQALWPRLEPARHVRRDPDHVPLLQVGDLVVQLDPARAGDHDVGLLLDLVLVADLGSQTGAVAEVAHSQLLGLDS